MRTLLAALTAFMLFAMPAGALTDRHNVAVTDDVKLFREYLNLAERGDAQSQFNVGGRLSRGEGVGRDIAGAVYWYRRAAVQGFVPAQTILGIFHSGYQDFPTDTVRSYAWLSIAIEQGSTHAKRARDIVLTLMTPEQIARSKELSSELWEKYVVPSQK